VVKVDAQESRRGAGEVSTDRLFSPGSLVTRPVAAFDLPPRNGEAGATHEGSDEAPASSTHRPMTAGKTSPPAAASHSSDVHIFQRMKI